MAELKDYKNSDFSLTVNNRMHGIELRFAQKMSEEQLANVKEAGFRWSKRQQMWYAYQNEKSIAYAESLVNYYKNTMSVQEFNQKVEEELSKIEQDNINKSEPEIIPLEPLKILSVEQVENPIEEITVNELAEKCNAPVIIADATNVEDLSNLVDGAMEHFGGKFDFVLHSVGMSPNIRKNVPYEELNYDFLSKTLDISAISFHKLIKVLYAKDALNDAGSIVALTYIAADRTVAGYSDMADAKALLQSITRSFGNIYGRRNGVRINTVSQSPTMTSAGQGIAGMDRMFEYADKLSPLGNADAADCADFLVMLFSDYTRKVTMQNLYHDGGFSSMAASQEIL